MFWILIMAIMAAVVPGKARGACNDEEVLSLLKRHEIKVLLSADHTPAWVAEFTRTSIDTVKRVAREADVTHVDDAAERRARKIGRPSKAAPFTESVKTWLEEDSELPTLELLRRANEDGYPGSKTAFYALVAGLRPTSAIPVVRFEGLPGEFSQHDFGQVDVRYLDGSQERVHFFASRLKYSRWAAVTVVDDERVETILRGLVADFAKFGGRPLMAVFDRPRTIVQKSGVGRDVETFNPTFAQGIVDIGVGVEMCAARSGNQKGSVERLVGWVKSSFFKPRKFHDHADMLAQLEAWLVTINTKTPSRATGVIPETRRLEELHRLRPNQLAPETFALRFPIVVSPSAEVMLDGVPYSMPPAAANSAGTILVYQDRVRIVAGRWDAEHRRRRKGEPRAPLPEHRAAKVAAVRGKRAKAYEKRQQLLELGDSAKSFLTEITHRDPKRALGVVDDLYALLERHDDDSLQRAFKASVDSKTFDVPSVVRALEKGARRDAGEPRSNAKATEREGPPRKTREATARPRVGAAQPRGSQVRAKHEGPRRAVRKEGRS